MLNTALREAQDGVVFERDGAVASNVEALVEIANRSLDTITDVARRDRFRLHVHVDVEDNTMIDGLGYRLPEWLRDLLRHDRLDRRLRRVGFRSASAAPNAQCRNAHAASVEFVTEVSACRAARQISSYMSIT